MTTSSVTRTIVVLDPTALPRQQRDDRALRRPDLKGQTIGFLWNSKPNGDILFSRLEELLRQRYEIPSAVHRRKPNASVPAARQVLDELATLADAVVVGLAD